MHSIKCLQTLVLDKVGIHAVKALAAATYLKRLRVVILGTSSVSQSSRAADGSVTRENLLAGAAWLPRLRQFALRECDISSTDQLWGAAVTALPKLQTLELTRPEPMLAGDARPSPLITSLAALDLPSLKLLDLRNIALDDGAARALFEAPWATGLTELRLSGTDISREGVAALCALPTAVLRVLSLHRTEAVKRDLSVLAAAPWLSGLQSLDLSDEDAMFDAAHSSEGWKQFCAAPLHSLRSLDLCGWTFEWLQCASLAEATWLTRLTSLAMDKGCTADDTNFWGMLEVKPELRLMEEAGIVDFNDICECEECGRATCRVLYGDDYDSDTDSTGRFDSDTESSDDYRRPRHTCFYHDAYRGFGY